MGGISLKLFQAISREQKELPEICECQNDRIFEGFSDFQKNEFLDFCISVIMDFFILFLYFAISQEQKEQRSAGVKATEFFRAFQIAKKKLLLDFCSSVFMDFCIFWIYGHNSGTKRATGDPWVSKQTDFFGYLT